MNDLLDEAKAALETDPVAKGKTKKIYGLTGRPGSALIVSTDDITAGDGAQHDIMAGKAAMSNRTNGNVFRLLQRCGIPVAFQEEVPPFEHEGSSVSSFVAQNCTMLHYEVIARRQALGSFLKRYPHIPEGHVFPKLLIELFLKTTDRKWKGHSLPCDDPFMVVGDEDFCLHLPKEQFNPERSFLVLPKSEVFTRDDEEDLLRQMEELTRRVFLILEKAWAIQGGILVDFKIEFGITQDGRLVVADVIDSDSWRVLIDREHFDKEAYRQGAELDDVARKFRHAMELTGAFRVPETQVLIWTGSEKDKEGADGISTEITQILGHPDQSVTRIVCSVHKEPVRGTLELNQAIANVPNTVVIALIGMSNGAGPTLSAATSVPVITIPASFGKFPDDAWSCLRTPSDVPVATVASPKNAALAALNILALSCPLVHSLVRRRVEERQMNVVEI